MVKTQHGLYENFRRVSMNHQARAGVDEIRYASSDGSSMYKVVCRSYSQN